MHQRKGKKILIYFFLLILVGSINNINLNNLKFKKIQDVKVIGLKNEDNLILLQDIKNLKLNNIFFINTNEINKIINSNSLIEKYEIFKRYPSSLKIKIDQTKFLAKINKDEKIFLVGSNGKLSESHFSNKNLPSIFGTPDVSEFLNFKKIIDRSRFTYDDIINLFFFPSKRWDIEINDNIIIKLSKNYTEDSLDLAFKFLHDKNFKDIKIIDARIKNQIILNDWRYLKNLYQDKLEIKNDKNVIDFNYLSKFLDNNIFKIEKLAGTFIKNIFVIIDFDENFYVNISVKKKNHNDFVNTKNLENTLIELKDLFKENYDEQTIMHMLIDNYIINGKNNFSFVDDVNCDFFCLEVKFISIPNELVIRFDKILEKYQIKITQYLNGSYVKNFFKKENLQLSEMAYNLRNGYNYNEVILVPKNIENRGFFEKFFQLFG